MGIYNIEANVKEIVWGKTPTSAKYLPNPGEITCVGYIGTTGNVQYDLVKARDEQDALRMARNLTVNPHRLTALFTIDANYDVEAKTFVEKIAKTMYDYSHEKAAITQLHDSRKAQALIPDRF